MYKHKSTNRASILTVTHDEKHYVFTPNKIITLNRVRKDLEVYGIICLNPDEKKVIIKKNKKEIKENDS